jgi:hypothetical protein
MFAKRPQTKSFAPFRQSLAISEAAFEGSSGTNREWTAPMFEENEVLTQLKALRQEVGSRLDDMDQRLRKIEAELSSPAMQGFGSRLEVMDRRLKMVESQLSSSAAGAVPQIGSYMPAPQNGTLTPESQNGHYAVEPQVEAPPVPTHSVEITISPLTDVAHVNVVEAALRSIAGVEAVTLQSLKGDGAEVAVDVQDGVSLIGGLRRTLPVAFDVSDADESSFTLGLVQPPVKVKGDPAVRNPV